jgi:RNA polymerase sigma-70 factor (ECF subfamily)
MPTSVFPETYRRYAAPVRAKCRRMLGAGAATEDIVQETFVRLWRSGPDVAESEPGRVMAWLYRTSTRLAIDVMRERARTPLDDVEGLALPCGGPTPDELLAARRLAATLATDFPEDELEAVLLTRVDGLSQQEVAEVLGVSERTVRRLVDSFDERAAKRRRRAEIA